MKQLWKNLQLSLAALLVSGMFAQGAQGLVLIDPTPRIENLQISSSQTQFTFTYDYANLYQGYLTAKLKKSDQVFPTVIKTWSALERESELEVLTGNGTDSLTFNFAGLPSGTYKFEISGFDVRDRDLRVNLGPLSQTFNVVTLIAPADIIPPASISNLQSIAPANGSSTYEFTFDYGNFTPSDYLQADLIHMLDNGGQEIVEKWDSAGSGDYKDVLSASGSGTAHVKWDSAYAPNGNYSLLLKQYNLLPSKSLIDTLTVPFTVSSGNGPAFSNLQALKDSNGLLQVSYDYRNLKNAQVFLKLQTISSNTVLKEWKNPELPESGSGTKSIVWEIGSNFSNCPCKVVLSGTTADGTSPNAQNNGTETYTLNPLEANVVISVSPVSMPDADNSSSPPADSSSSSDSGNSSDPSADSPIITNPNDQCAGFKDVAKTDPNCAAIDWTRSIGAFTGNPDGTLRLYDNLQRDQIVKVLLELADQYDPSMNYCNNQKPYSDISLAMWNANYLCRSKALSLTTGYLSGPDAGKYLPGNNVSIAEFLTLLSRHLNVDLSGGVSYADVPAGTWYSEGAQMAYQWLHDVFPGSYLHPNQPVNRLKVIESLYELHLAGKL